MAWEESARRPRVAVGMLFKEDTIYKDMFKAGIAFQREPGWIFLFQTSIPRVDIARNVCASQAYHSGAEYLFFWDSDVNPPPNIVPRLMMHGLPIVSGLYWRRHPTTFPEVFRRNEKGIPVPMKEGEVRAMSGQLIECDVVGLGCTLIHRIVLEKLAEKSEKFRMLDPESGAELEVYKFMEFKMEDLVTISEDAHFCSRIQHELGYKIFADLGLNCGHLCAAEVYDGKLDFPALEYGRERE